MEPGKTTVVLPTQIRRTLKQSPCQRDWLHVSGWTKVNPASVKHKEFILCYVSAVKLKWWSKDRKTQSDTRQIPTNCITGNLIAIFFPLALPQIQVPREFQRAAFSRITFLLSLLAWLCSSKLSGLICFVSIPMWTTCPCTVGILVSQETEMLSSS